MIKNPIEALLTPLPVISANNIEVGQVIYSNTQDTKNQIVDNFLRNKTDFTPLGKLGIDSIVVMKCSNWTTYNWLETYPNCELKRETDTYMYYSCR